MNDSFGFGVVGLFLTNLWNSFFWTAPLAPWPEELEAVKTTLSQPGVLTAALNYYRHSFNPAKHHPSLESIRDRQDDPISVPTLYIRGADDGGIGVECAEGMEKAFTAGLEKHIIPGAGHFVHQEKPEAVNRLLLAFLKRNEPA